jgi:hypothetical protein
MKVLQASVDSSGPEGKTSKKRPLHGGILFDVSQMGGGVSAALRGVGG